MAFSTDDFAKIWASTSPLTPYSFSDSNYQEGWNFVGATPPARQMWDSIQKLNDEKLQYLFNVEDGFLEKLITAFASDLDSLPAGTAFTATTALSKMIANMMAEDGVQYNLSNSSAWYIKFGAKYGGLIIQGGTESITLNNAETSAGTPYNYRGSKDVNYPISFSTFNIAFANALDSCNFWLANCRTTGLSNCNIILCASANTTGSRDVEWFAIGV